MFESQGASQEYWWKVKANIHAPLSSMVSYLQATNRGLREDARFYMELTSNFNVGSNGCDTNGMRRASGSKMRHNLCQASVDTGASLILMQRTVPIWTTVDDFKLARVAERRTRAIQGQFHKLDVFDLAVDIGIDALQTGTGFALGYVDRGPDGKSKPKPVIERVLPNEILVDSVDGQYRAPRSIYRIKLIAREQLMALYPAKAAQLRTAGGPTERDYIDFFIRRDNKADFVRVYEAWHLPSWNSMKDGRHVIATDNVDLRDEVYTADVFPLVAYRYAQRRMGYFGQGLVERACPAQIRLSELQQAKRDMQRLCSNPYMMIEQNSGVQFTDMTNMPGQMVKYQRTMPQLVVFEGTPGDLSQEEAQIKQELWEQEGFSQMMQQGEVNKGLASGRAVRAADDVASRRHVQPIRLFESLYLDFTKLLETLNDQCAEIDPNYTVIARYRAGGKSWVKEDRWLDLALPETASCNVFPISALPSTPAGMWSALEEMTVAGMVGKNMAMDLMQAPDIQAFDTMVNSNLDLTRHQIDHMLDGIPELPIPQQFFQDPAESPLLVTQALLVAYRMAAPPEIIELFETYLAHARMLVEGDQTQALTQAPAALNQAAMNAATVAAQTPQAMPAMPVAA